MSASLESEAAATGHPSAESPGTSAQMVSDLLRVAHRMRSVLNSHLSPFNLTDVRLSVLKIVAQSAAGGCSQSELAKKLDQWESSISSLVDRMRESRLLHRLQAKSDRRKRVLVLSEQGRELLTLAEQAHQQRIDALFGQFSPQQQQAFATLLDLLLTELSQFEPSSTNKKTSAQPHQNDAYREPADSAVVLPTASTMADLDTPITHDVAELEGRNPAA